MATITVAELLKSMKKHAEASRAFPPFSPMSFYRHLEDHTQCRCFLYKARFMGLTQFRVDLTNYKIV
jgi:hypothetical protein